MILVTRTVEVPYPVRVVSGLLDDPIDALGCNPHVKYFTAAAGSGPHLRSRYHAVERVGGLRLALEYRVLHQEPGRAAVLLGRNRLLDQTDIIVLRQLPDGRTRITRQVQFSPRGPMLLGQRWLRTGMEEFVEASARAIARLIERSLAGVPGVPPPAPGTAASQALLRR